MNLQCESQASSYLSAKVISGRGLATKQLSLIKELKEYELISGSLNLLIDKPVNFDEAECVISTSDVTRRYFWNAKINDIDVILYRWRGSRLHTVEVLASVRLRTHLGLHDEDYVKVEVSNNILRPIRARDLILYKLLWSMGRESWPYKSELYQASAKYLEAALGTLQK